MMNSRDPTFLLKWFPGHSLCLNWTSKILTKSNRIVALFDLNERIPIVPVGEHTNMNLFYYLWMTGKLSFSFARWRRGVAAPTYSSGLISTAIFRVKTGDRNFLQKQFLRIYSHDLSHQSVLMIKNRHYVYHLLNILSSIWAERE